MPLAIFQTYCNLLRLNKSFWVLNSEERSNQFRHWWPSPRDPIKHCTMLTLQKYKKYICTIACTPFANFVNGHPKCQCFHECPTYTCLGSKWVGVCMPCAVSNKLYWYNFRIIWRIGFVATKKIPVHLQHFNR